MLNYIIENSAWIATFIVIEIACWCHSYYVFKCKPDLLLNFKRQIITIAVESTILLSAVIYTGAPAWVVVSLVVLAVIGLTGPLMFKLKYGL